MFIRWYIYPFVYVYAWILLTTTSFSNGESTIYKKSLLNQDGYLYTGYYSSYNVQQIISEDLINKHIVFFTAHPDDESMFFAPTITELSKDNYNNHIHVICLSNGGMDGLGKIREKELQRAATILGIDSVKTLDYEDNINVFWETEEVVNTIKTELTLLTSQYNLKADEVVLITFDKDGVSNHPNHKSIFNAVSEFKKSTYITTYFLVSWNIAQKYSGIFVTDYELIKKNIYNMLDWGSPFEANAIVLFSDLNTVFLNLSSMSWAHYSQIVWFRWIWIFTSKYMNSNKLVKM